MAEQSMPAQSVGENDKDFCASTNCAMSDVATSSNATDCACNGSDTVLGFRSDSGMSHDDYYDTISVSAGRCCTNPATIGSVSFRTIGGNGSSSHLAYQHTSAASTTAKLIKILPLLTKGGASREDCMEPHLAKGGAANTCMSDVPFVVRSVQSKQ